MKKSRHSWWKWVVFTFVLFAAIIGGPIIINECYKPNAGYITKWNAADVLAYYGTFLAAVGAFGGVFLSLNFSHMQYREDKRRDVLPYFSVNTLERNCIDALSVGWDDGEKEQNIEKDVPSYHEYLCQKFFFVISGNGPECVQKLPEEQETKRRISFSDEDEKRYGEICKNNTSYIPIEITNVGKGCAINMTVTIDPLSPQKSVSSPSLSIPVGENIYIGVFFCLNEELNEGYLLKIRYSDIYENLYEHRKTIRVTTNGDKRNVQIAPETAHHLINTTH